MPINPKSQTIFLNEKYLLFHLDKRWELFPLIVRENLKKKLVSLANNSKIVITSNIGSNNFFDYIVRVIKTFKVNI